MKFEKEVFSKGPRSKHVHRYIRFQMAKSFFRARASTDHSRMEIC